MALRVDLTGPVLRPLTKDKRTASGIGKTDVNDPRRKLRLLFEDSAELPGTSLPEARWC